MPLRHCLVAIALLALATGCRGDDGTPRPTGILSTVTIAVTGTPPSETVTATEQPGYIASPLPSPGRAAPDAVSGPLTFSQVRVFADPATGNFVLRANAMNIGAEFLNDAVVIWTIIDAAAMVLDDGETTIASLAPGETTSIELIGAAQHDDHWSSVEFAFTGAAQ